MTLRTVSVENHKLRSTSSITCRTWASERSGSCILQWSKITLA